MRRTASVAIFLLGLATNCGGESESVHTGDAGGSDTGMAGDTAPETTETDTFDEPVQQDPADDGDTDVSSDDPVEAEDRGVEDSSVPRDDPVSNVDSQADGRSDPITSDSRGAGDALDPDVTLPTDPLSIVSPEENQLVDCVLEIRLELPGDITLVLPPRDLVNVAGEGHLHFIVAGYRIPNDARDGIDQPRADVPVHPLVSSGPQDLDIVLHNNDHTPMFRGRLDRRVMWEKVEPGPEGCGG